MAFREKRILKEMLKDAETLEEKKEIIFEWLKEQNKDEKTKELIRALGIISISLLIPLSVLTFKELFKL